MHGPLDRLDEVEDLQRPGLDDDLQAWVPRRQRADVSDRLTVLHSDASGVWRLQCDAAWLPSGEPAVYIPGEGTLFERVGDAVNRVAAGAEQPSVWIDPGGTRHVAFERTRRVYYTRSTDGQAWTDASGGAGDEMVAHFCSSWPSIATTPAGTVLIACQGEGKLDLRRHPERYARLRPGGGSTISYALHDGARWAIHDLLRSSEIIIKRRVGTNLIASGRSGSFETHMEELWRPSLAVDLHGVPWMFWLNTTRRHVYFARFGGETFGDHYEARGPYDCLSRTMLVQKDSCGQPAIGVMTFAANELYFDRHPVPQYSSAEARRVTFIDGMELAEWRGVEHRLGRWQKHPEPIFGQGISGDSRDDDIAWCEVAPTAEGFEMRYMGQGELRSNTMPGRAVSADGLHWERMSRARSAR